MTTEDLKQYPILNDEDVSASRDLALLCYCERDEDGDIDRVYDNEYGDGENTWSRNAGHHFSGFSHDFMQHRTHERPYGQYKYRPHHADDPKYLSVSGEDGETFLMSYAAAVIIQAAAPRFKMHHLYDLFIHNNGSELFRKYDLFQPILTQIDRPVLDPSDYYYDGPQRYQGTTTYGVAPYVHYGAIGRAVGQAVELEFVAENGESAIVNILCNDDLSVKEKRQQLWLGPRNLWSYTAPNRFPIAKALTSETPFASFSQEPNANASGNDCPGRLTLDIMEEIVQYLRPRSLFFLLHINCSTRASLLPRIHVMTYKYIATHTPHLLCQRSNKEP